MTYKPLSSYKIDRIKVSFVEESPPGHVGQILEGFNSSKLIVIWREASVVLLSRTLMVCTDYARGMLTDISINSVPNTNNNNAF